MSPQRHPVHVDMSRFKVVHKQVSKQFLQLVSTPSMSTKGVKYHSLDPEYGANDCYRRIYEYEECQALEDQTEWREALLNGTLDNSARARRHELCELSRTHMPERFSECITGYFTASEADFHTYSADAVGADRVTLT
jgi:hypothetical protein